jgi:hypothetical protein
VQKDFTQATGLNPATSPFLTTPQSSVSWNPNTSAINTPYSPHYATPHTPFTPGHYATPPILDDMNGYGATGRGNQQQQQQQQQQQYSSSMMKLAPPPGTPSVEYTTTSLGNAGANGLGDPYYHFSTYSETGRTNSQHPQNSNTSANGALPIATLTTKTDFHLNNYKLNLFCDNLESGYQVCSYILLCYFLS